MTHNQKLIVSKLFEGHTIVPIGPGLFRLRDAEGRPILKVSGSTFHWLDQYLLRERKGLYLINKSKMRQFHGNSFVNRLYKGKEKPIAARRLGSVKANRSTPPNMPTLF